MARPRKFDEAAVIAAAATQFRKTGFAGTSLDDLMAATGLGKGSLYGAFGDKQQLFERAFGTYCDGGLAMMEAELAGPDAGALARLTALMHEQATDCARGKAACLLSMGTPEVTARTRETYAGMEARLAGCIAAAQRAGEVGAHVDPVVQAGLLLAVMRGMEALGRGGVGEAELVRTADAALAGLR